MGDKKPLFSFLKRKHNKKQEPKTTETAQNRYENLAFMDNDFFFEDGIQTDFNNIRMNFDGVLTLVRIRDYYKLYDPKMTDNYMFGLVYHELESAIDHARNTIREKYGKDYNPRAEMYHMGGDINRLYNMPGTIESQYQYRVVEELSKLFPISTRDDEPELK